MNKVILIGRIVRDPEIRTSQNQKATTIAKYTLAVERRFKKDGEQSADFINCIAFGKNAEFAEKWFRKGIKIVIAGHIQTGSYTNKDGQKVHTTDVIIDEQEFAESKASSEKSVNEQNAPVPSNAPSDGFMNITDDELSNLPFS